jgi:predicted Zn finger-like uncharacterized protein
MELTTRCPQCGTVFSASLQQLQLRKGYVRCIQCAHIFDGYEAVVSGDDEQAMTPPAPKAPAVAPAIPAAASQAPAPVRRAPQDAAAAPLPSVLRQRTAGPGNEVAPTVPVGDPKEPVMATQPTPSTQRHDGFTISSRPPENEPTFEEPEFHLGSVVSTPVRPEPTVEPLQADPQAAKAQRTEARRVPAESIYMPPERARKQAEPAPWDARPDHDAPSFSGVMRVVWGVLILAGLLVFLAQLVYVYRAQIANNIPMLRPALEQVCVPLHCTVAYARRIDAISIMSSSLRAGTGSAVGAEDAKAETGNMTLQLTLRNTYDRPQEWPTLVLDLTDFSGTLVVRKNLRPEDYLGPELRQRPFAAGSELTVTLPVALGNMQVNGYQLSKFFQ